MLLLRVGELTQHIRHILEVDDLLQDMWVRGEVSNFSRASSGHCYFSLKDQSSVIRAVIWRSHAAKLHALPANGDEVLAHGKVSFYEGSGDVQFYADSIRPAGIGVHQAAFEQLRARLEQEGLFHPARKRTLPAWPQRIGVVTSPQAAALQDVLRVVSQRYPLAEIVVAPCAVQGEHAPPTIVTALRQIQAVGVDLILLVRGGGSIEDLWAFNDEQVARAIFASRIPVVTGVGHETDTTIVDFVADVRASTPSAAAALATPDQRMLRAAALHQQQLLAETVVEHLEAKRRMLTQLQWRLQRVTPLRFVQRWRQSLDMQGARLQRSCQHVLTARQRQLHVLQARLTALSPQATLQRGYALVQHHGRGRVVTAAAQVQAGDHITIRFAEGQRTAQIVADAAEKRLHSAQ